MITLFPLLLMIVGALVWALSANPKAQRMGEHGFWIGLFWLTAGLASKTVNLFG